MSISTELTALQTDITNARTAITNKGGTVTSGGGSSQLATDIATIPSGGSEVEPKDINFYDYDGTLVESWTLEELATKTELPTQPDHSSDIEYAGQTIPLTADGWNWTLADLQSVNHTGINVGSTYKTTDDKLNICIYIRFDNDTRSITFSLNGTATIDWGDGTVDTVTGNNVSTNKTTSHTYASKGNYIIKIGKTSGTVRIAQLLDVLLFLEYVYYSNQLEYNIYSFGMGSQVSRNLKYMTIPKTATLVSDGGTSFGTNCNSLKFLVLPFRYGYNSFINVYNLKGVSLAYYTGSVWAFDFVTRLEEFPYMANITSINKMSNLYCLKKYTVPSTVTTIATGFLGNASSIRELKFEPTTPPTISGTSFSGMNTLCKILVPQGTLEAYTTATNYPSPSTYAYEEY